MNPSLSVYSFIDLLFHQDVSPMRSDGSLGPCLSLGLASRTVPGWALSLPLAMFVPVYASASAPTPSGEMHTCKMKDCQAELVGNNHKYYCLFSYWLSNSCMPGILYWSCALLPVLSNTLQDAYYSLFSMCGDRVPENHMAENHMVHREFEPRWCWLQSPGFCGGTWPAPEPSRSSRMREPGSRNCECGVQKL